jgi:hypothetical protein
VITSTPNASKRNTSLRDTLFFCQLMSRLLVRIPAHFHSCFLKKSQCASRLELQMLLAEWQDIGDDATLCTPVRIRVPKPVVFFGFMHNAKLMELVREHMVRIEKAPFTQQLTK